MRIEVCIPAHNEADIIAQAVWAVDAECRKLDLEYRLLVVSNGSEDDTEQIAREAGTDVLSLLQTGKGGAIIAAARQSSANIFCFIDADLSADPADMTKITNLILSDACDIAIGSRLIDTGIVDRSFLRTFSSRIFNVLRILILGIRAKDTQCGLKAMNARGKGILAACEETGWFFDMEFLARAERAGMRIAEVPIHWDEFRFPSRPSKLNMVRDGFGAVRAMLRIRRRIAKGA